MGFAEDEIRKHFLAWNPPSRAIKHIVPSYLANCCVANPGRSKQRYYARCKTTTHESAYERTCETWL